MSTQEKLDIQELINRYSLAINRRDFAAIAPLFTPDAHWEVAGNATMRFDGAALPPGIRGLVEPVGFLMQMNSPATIELEGDRATASSIMHELAHLPELNQHVDVYAIYEDIVVRSSGKWQFKSRVFHTLNLRITQLNPK